MSEPEVFSLQYDSATGRPILAAPNRTAQPLHTVAGKDGPDVCPFCVGSEAMTTAETDALRDPGTAPDTPGWQVRAFPNLYPAAQWHEVIVEGPEHLIQPGDLDVDGWLRVLTMWRRRIAHFESHDEVRCAYLFKNVGRMAGASIAHNHSQLLGLPLLPPRLEIELEREQRLGPQPARELEHAEREGRLVIAGARHAAFSPSHPKLPFETWLCADDPAGSFDEPDADADRDLAATLRAWCRAVDAAFDRPPFNLYLHRVPGESFQWHFELQPRHRFIAGLEFGGDMYINAVTAQTAAAQLRAGAEGSSR